MAVGDILPCPIRDHLEYCTSPLHDPAKRKAARRHEGCWLCHGARRVKVLAEDEEGNQEVEPYRE